MSALVDKSASEDEPELLLTQALIVTEGPFKGRICENDDDEFVFFEDLSSYGLTWIRTCGAVFRTIRSEDLDEFDVAEAVGIDCEIVTFGDYFRSRGTHSIPRQFLRPATMDDLISRSQAIDNIIFHRRFGGGGKRLPEKQISDLLVEQAYISSEIYERDKLATQPKGSKNLFLCHASSDKWMINRIHADLVRVGHSAWLDQFEINVGDSIVEKIEAATAKADALILFLSKSAMASAWVSREWQSAVARWLSGGNVRVFPVLLEECDRPSILADIKFADFRESYSDGLTSLLKAVNKMNS